MMDCITKNVKNGSAPGPSGWTGELLHQLCQDEECLKGITTLVQCIVNGTISDGKTKELLLSCRLLAATKKNGGVRPIAIGECFVRAAAQFVMSKLKPSLPGIFKGTVQLGCGQPGGSIRAVHTIRGHLANSSTSALIAIDFRSAFNTRSRHAMATAIYHPKLKAAWRLFHFMYRSATPLLVYNQGQLAATIPSARGVRQGDALGSLAFATSVYKPFYQSGHREDVDMSPDSDDVISPPIASWSVPSRSKQ